MDDPSFEVRNEKKKHFIDPELCRALDRAGYTNRMAFAILSNFADPKSKISISTLARHRKKIRLQEVQKVQESFVSGPALTVHFDSKLMIALKNKKKENRVAIIITGPQVEGYQFLNTLPADSGKGTDEADLVYKVLCDWNLVDKVVGLCFDTTATNTGCYSGACTMLENLIERRLYFFACRHHILEIVLSHVFDIVFGASNSPEIQIFKRFATGWENHPLGISAYRSRTGVADEDMEEFLLSNRAEILPFCKRQLNEYLPREDYREILELILIIYGESRKHVIPHDVFASQILISEIWKYFSSAYFNN